MGLPGAKGSVSITNCTVTEILVDQIDGFLIKE